MMPPAHLMQAAAQRRGVRAFLWLMVVAGVVSCLFALFTLVTIGDAFADAMGRHDGCDGCTEAGPGAEVLRDGRRVAQIRQIAAPNASRPLLLLATASGAVIDSARSGQLVGRVEARAATGAWRIALVPQAAVQGLTINSALVVAPGESPIPVYGRIDTLP